MLVVFLELIHHDQRVEKRAYEAHSWSHCDLVWSSLLLLYHPTDLGKVKGD